MTSLLEKALEKVGSLPRDEQDAIASEILASLADEEAWKKRLRRSATLSDAWREKPSKRMSEARPCP
jgi:hypothetical protein